MLTTNDVLEAIGLDENEYPKYQREKRQDLLDEYKNEQSIEYCLFTVEELINAHKELLKQIKGWEKICDKAVNDLYKHSSFENKGEKADEITKISESIEAISQEMMSINS